MRTVSGMACIVMGLAIVGPAFDVRATTEGRDEFLRVNPSNEVSRSYKIGLCVGGGVMQKRRRIIHSVVQAEL